MRENIIKTYTSKYLLFKDYPKTKSFSIRDIFIEHWNDFCIYADKNNLNIRDIVYYEVSKMMKCRTKQLGYSLYECPNCHNIHIQIIPTNLNFVLLVVINILKNVLFLLHLNFTIVIIDILFLQFMTLYGIFFTSI